MSLDKQNYVKLINTNIKEIITDIVLSLQCGADKKEAVNLALAFLADIVQIYEKDGEKLFGQALDQLAKIKYLYQFEVEVLVSSLHNKFFNRLHIFKQAYEISVLKLDAPKYSHLKVEQPLIRITIPKPFLSQPLNDAKFIGEAKMMELQEEDTVQRFS